MVLKVGKGHLFEPRLLLLLFGMFAYACEQSPSDNGPKNVPVDSGPSASLNDLGIFMDSRVLDAMADDDSGLAIDVGFIEDASTSPDAVVAHDAGCEVLDSGPSSVCGDGVLEPNEHCDDGNSSDGDGCSSACTIEPQCTAGCLEHTDCTGDLRCIGRPRSVTGATGQCTDTSSVAGEDTPCSTQMPCGPGLACLGEFAYASGGWCVAEWFAKDFFSFDDLSIPDSGLTITSSIVACGLATVPVDMVVTLHLDHPRPEDLTVVLRSPNTADQAVLLNQEPYTPGPIIARGIPGDDAVNGIWSLQVTDSVPGETGRLLGWSVYLLSRWD